MKFLENDETSLIGCFCLALVYRIKNTTLAHGFKIARNFIKQKFKFSQKSPFNYPPSSSSRSAQRAEILHFLSPFLLCSISEKALTLSKNAKSSSLDIAATNHHTNHHPTTTNHRSPIPESKMIVRTYGRRNRTISGTCSGSSLNDDVSEPFSTDSLSQEQDPLFGNFAFSSQDSSSQWSLFNSDPNSIDDLCGAGRRESKRAKSVAGKKGFSFPATSTLMEAQEFGEMMEHVDEVNFALDGLRKGQPVRIRRASLVSLLSICATTQQRRLLRSQGYVNFSRNLFFLLNLNYLCSIQRVVFVSEFLLLCSFFFLLIWDLFKILNFGWVKSEDVLFFVC